MQDLTLILDFVNTADLEGGGDELSDGAGLTRWLAAHRLISGSGHATAQDAADARAARESLRQLLRANNGIGSEVDEASATLDAVARKTGLAVRFDDCSIRLVPRTTGVAGGLGVVLATAAQAMADGSWQRLKACRSESCSWAFIDESRNRSRQWCSMSVCGNREKARVFRERHG